MRISPRLNRYEKREMQAEKLKNDMAGSGIYVYENNTDADLKLPKPTASGIRTVGPRKRFQGDSYFMSWVGNPMNLLKFIETIVPKMTLEEKKAHEKLLEENALNTQKQLILDQPDTVTTAGKIERVVVTPDETPLNDTTNPVVKKTNDVLLTEDPLDGVQIILG